MSVYTCVYTAVLGKRRRSVNVNSEHTGFSANGAAAAAAAAAGAGDGGGTVATVAINLTV